MARNGTGTMAVINSFSANTTIESAKINANFTDIASEITGSLPRDGQAGMTGAFKAASGTAAAPGMTFGSGTTSGLYLIGATEVGAAIGGTKVATLDSAGWKNASGTKYDAFASGTKLLFYSNTAPTGWTIQTSSINDKALRVVSGSGAGGGTGGATGGTTDFTSVFTARTIAKANLPNYNMTDSIVVADHKHKMFVNSVGSGSGSVTSTSEVFVEGRGTGGADYYYSMEGASGTPSVGETSSDGGHTVSVSVALGGSGTALDFAVAYASVIIAAKD
jgi:hypothetical protein